MNLFTSSKKRRLKLEVELQKVKNELQAERQKRRNLAQHLKQLNTKDKTRINRADKLSVIFLASFCNFFLVDRGRSTHTHLPNKLKRHKVFRLMAANTLIGPYSSARIYSFYLFFLPVFACFIRKRSHTIRYDPSDPIQSREYNRLSGDYTRLSIASDSFE